jgi:FkbM family methyltransferase
MKIKFKDIAAKYGLPEGVIHIGAHKMEEREDYLASDIKDIIWIEANPELVNHNQSLISSSESVFECAISDVDNKIYDFNITNNGESSSILDLDLHKIHYPRIYVTETIKVKSKRIDTLIKENSINIKDHDFVNIDIQGAELLALKGFGKLLNNIKFIYTEINTNYLYKDCALVSEIDEYLEKYGFERVETSMTKFEWGDALYFKK